MDSHAIHHIHIRDQYSRMYEPELSLILPQETALRLFRAISAQTPDNSLIMRQTLYTICFEDADGNTLDEYDADTFLTIQGRNGLKYEKSGEIGEILQAIADECNLSSALLRRPPAENYFSLMTNVRSGSLSTVTRNYLDEAPRFDLHDDQLKTLCHHWQDFQITDNIIRNVDPTHFLTLYDEQDNVIYTFHIDKNRQLYTSYGYPMDAALIQEMVKTLLNE